MKYSNAQIGEFMTKYDFVWCEPNGYMVYDLDGSTVADGDGVGRGGCIEAAMDAVFEKEAEDRRKADARVYQSIADNYAQDLRVGTQSSHPFIGKYVIARCAGAGVHAGTLVSVDGDSAILKDSRRLWRWTANGGVALSGLAQLGLKSGTIDVVNPTIQLNGVCELIPCSEASQESIHGA